ncbi:lipoprotein ABC transporter ATP-binding protein [Candidatus Magnetomorum sp. HK-1]|nr:lipoprotein ABC transporter ATP-binding protein [Candidatus Magnetomorum sp. HK-1]
MEQSIINVINLNRTYNLIEGKQLVSRQQIFDNLNFSVNCGEFVAVVGPSGCGKSTLLNIIGNLDSVGNKNYVKVYSSKGNDKEVRIPEIEGEGKVYVNEQDIGKLKGAKKARFINQNIGFIFQFHHLIPELTALQNVALPMQINGQSKKAANQKALSLLKEMDLERHANRKPDILSGGEKQRVAIARSLINNPDILLADEPTGSLHPQFKKDIINLFIRLNQKKNITIVMVTHDVESLYNEQKKLLITRLFSLTGSPVDSVVC